MEGQRRHRVLAASMLFLGRWPRRRRVRTGAMLCRSRRCGGLSFLVLMEMECRV